MTRSRSFSLALSFIALAALGLALIAASSLKTITATKTEPEDGAVVDRPVRNLRVWFDQAPDVDRSTLHLRGPNGELEVVGLHSMGDDDLMARVTGAMPNGEYTAHWSAVAVEDEGEPVEGEWGFTIQRGR